MYSGMKMIANGFAVSGFLVWILSGLVWFAVLGVLFRGGHLPFIGYVESSFFLAGLWFVFGGIATTLAFGPIAQLLLKTAEKISGERI